MKTFIAAVCALSIAAVASASPVPLATIEWASISGSNSATTPIDGMSFGFDYGFFLPARCLGCTSVLAVGATGIFTFDATNSPAFAFVASQLTDGINEPLSTEVEWYSGGNLRNGNGFAPLESTRLGSPDLAGHTVDFVQLDILTNTITPTVVNGQPGFRSDFDVKWTVFGDDAGSAAVPEPASLVLVGGGMVALARRRFKKK